MFCSLGQNEIDQGTLTYLDNMLDNFEHIKPHLDHLGQFGTICDYFLDHLGPLLNILDNIVSFRTILDRLELKKKKKKSGQLGQYLIFDQFHPFLTILNNFEPLGLPMTILDHV